MITTIQSLPAAACVHSRLRRISVAAALVTVLSAGGAADAVAGPGGGAGTPAKVPFVKSLVAEIGTGEHSGWASIDVPSGKRLVIEHISANIELPASEGLYELAFFGVKNEATHYLTMTERPYPPMPGWVSYRVSLPYQTTVDDSGDALGDVLFFASRALASSVRSAVFTVSGYMTDAQ